MKAKIYIHLPHTKKNDIKKASNSSLPRVLSRLLLQSLSALTQIFHVPNNQDSIRILIGNEVYYISMLKVSRNIVTLSSNSSFNRCHMKKNKEGIYITTQLKSKHHLIISHCSPVQTSPTILYRARFLQKYYISNKQCVKNPTSTLQSSVHMERILLFSEI